MTCENSQTMLHGYLDGELDSVRAEEFERHLENCSQCIAQLEQQEKLRVAFRVADLYERAPDSLRRRVRVQTVGEISDYQWSWLSIWKWAATSAVIIFVLAGTYLGIERYVTTRPQTEQSAALTEAIDAHVRAMQPGHLTDVLSTDQHTVKPWFVGKLDYVPAVRDLSENGFPLVGGRLDVLNGRSVAALVYGRRKHLISVFVWPDGATGSETAALIPAAGSRNGYQWNYWRAHGMEFCAISDVSAADLHDLAELLQE